MNEDRSYYVVSANNASSVKQKDNSRYPESFILTS